jgi:hypothetical protein
MMDVFCVFYLGDGAKFLDHIFSDAMDAQYYIESQPVQYQRFYQLQTWEVE